MRLSKHVGKTLKETPREAQITSHKLMLRAGMIKQLSAGIYSYMPLMFRSIQKITNIVREEMDAKDAEELLMPALQPKELWIESGRWERYTEIDGIMFALENRRKKEECLGPTHEEVITDIVRREINSYKDLPVNLYQIQTKFRDEIRPRFGLIRAREFIMKDAYSFDTNNDGANKSYQDMHDAYVNIFTRCGLNFTEVEADGGAIGGAQTHEFMVFAGVGEDTIVQCDSCDYSANMERAESRLEEFQKEEKMKDMEEVLGEELIGVEPLAKFLGIPVWKTTKTLLYQTDQGVVAVMVRGDCSVNETKVINHLGCKEIELATEATVKRVTGAKIGYAGPIGLTEDVKVIADNYCNNRINFEAGANKTNYHNINVNFERDFPLPEFGDFKASKAGDLCPRCDKGKLKESKGIEVGHIFKLGTKYSKALNCNFLDKDGNEHPMIMGCYGIGVSRIASAVIEQHHDDRGIIWPASIAPYTIHLVGLNSDDEATKKETDSVYKKLQTHGIDVLYDDRDEVRAGEKFSDADLIGIPLRITVSKRTLKEKKYEMKLRTEKENKMATWDELIKAIESL